jgi:uncharacterized protein (UPF0548 family)
VITLGTPGDPTLDRILAELAGSTPTYPEVGATAGSILPAGYRHDRYTAVIGSGGDAFQRAADGLRRWEPHRRAGFRMYPPTPAIEDGLTALGLLRLGLLVVVFGWRVVYTVKEPKRFGFAYGTLPGHPEQGEERFVVEQHDDGSVSYDLVAFSRPVGWARLGAPLARRIQVQVTHRYLRGLQDFVKGESR